MPEFYIRSRAIISKVSNKDKQKWNELDPNLTDRKKINNLIQAILKYDFPLVKAIYSGDIKQIESILKPSIIKDTEDTKSEFDFEEWEQRRDEACPLCKSKPYEIDGQFHIYCPLPLWVGKGKSKGEKGVVRIESCYRQQNYFLKGKEKEEKEIDLMKDKISQLNVQIERLEGERTEEYKESADKLRSWFRGESILCHLKKRIIPLCQCFEDQIEHAKTPKHFIPPSSEYCPCRKFEALEFNEMAKYQNLETIPWMNPEVKDMPLIEIEKLYGIGEPFKEGKDDDLFDNGFLDDAFPIEIDRYGEDRRDLMRDGKFVSLLEVEEKEK